MLQFQASAWITVAALLVYFWTVFKVGRARGLYKVIAPAVDGPPEFLRAMRVQANTVEQLIFFLPALWLCAVYFSDRWAGLGGALWVLGRIMYASAYYREASKRSTGFALATTASVALLVCAILGLLGVTAH
jgi:glutathione S-transferase